MIVNATFRTMFLENDLWKPSKQCNFDHFTNILCFEKNGLEAPLTTQTFCNTSDRSTNVETGERQEHDSNRLMLLNVCLDHGTWWAAPMQTHSTPRPSESAIIYSEKSGYRGKMTKNVTSKGFIRGFRKRPWHHLKTNGSAKVVS